jgi:hypothetical protein
MAKVDSTGGSYKSMQTVEKSLSIVIPLASVMVNLRALILMELLKLASCFMTVEKVT